MRRARDKILPRDALAERLDAARPRCLVLANGLFDLLHVGHARYLAAARRAGDRLVVALNDDDSARSNKGPTRPIVPLDERLELVAALASVDHVTHFPERSVAATLRLLRPSLHAKGTDYRPETLPEDEQTEHDRLEIRVVCVGDPKTHATSDIIRAVLDRP